MIFPSVKELIPILQVAIGPVILISGVGMLLLSMTNRFGRVIDRARILNKNLLTEGQGAHVQTHAQLQILWRRADLIRRAIIFASVSVLMTACLIITLFFTSLLRLDVGWLIVLLFIGCLVALIVAISLFILDINQSLLALKLELKTALANTPDTETK